MHDKALAGILSAVVIAPVCALCILGPAMLGSALGGLTGWFTGLGPVLSTGLAIIAGLLVYGYFRRKKERSAHAVQSEQR